MDKEKMEMTKLKDETRERKLSLPNEKRLRSMSAEKGAESLIMSMTSQLSLFPSYPEKSFLDYNSKS